MARARQNRDGSSTVLPAYRCLPTCLRGMASLLKQEQYPATATANLRALAESRVPEPGQLLDQFNQSPPGKVPASCPATPTGTTT